MSRATSPQDDDAEERDRIATAAAEIGLLWRRALDHAHRGAGCGCCGGHVVLLDDATLEQDVLFYLQSLYGADPLGLGGVVERRRTSRVGSLSAWLAGLAQSLDIDAAERLTDDLGRVLQSIGSR